MAVADSNAGGATRAPRRYQARRVCPRHRAGAVRWGWRRYQPSPSSCTARARISATSTIRQVDRSSDEPRWLLEQRFWRPVGGIQPIAGPAEPGAVRQPSLAVYGGRGMYCASRRPSESAPCSCWRGNGRGYRALFPDAMQGEDAGIGCRLQREAGDQSPLDRIRLAKSDRCIVRGEGRRGESLAGTGSGARRRSSRAAKAALARVSVCYHRAFASGPRSKG